MKTIIPFKRFSFVIKDAKHVFVFFQQSQKQNALDQNPYFFDTFDLDGDNSAKLSSCRLQYGSTYYPYLDYEGEDLIRIRRDLIEFRYRKNDPNSGTQINSTNYPFLYPIVYFDLRATKESMTGDAKKMILHCKLNEAANAHDFIIFAAMLNEEEVVIKAVGNKLVVA